MQKLRRSQIHYLKLVVTLLMKMGYGVSIKDAGKAIGRTSYSIIDGIINEDKLYWIRCSLCG
jgi:restriction system protein